MNTKMRVAKLNLNGKERITRLQGRFRKGSAKSMPEAISAIQWEL